MCGGRETVDSLALHVRLLGVGREVINMNLAWLLASGALVAVALQNAVVVVDNQVCDYG